MEPVTSGTCPRCGTALTPDAPQGLCPKCLLAAAIPPEESVGLDASALASAIDAAAETVAPSAAHEEAGTSIGRYKLLEKIGEGGMGVVYMAEQQRPVVRRVAIKIIKLGMDTRQVIARFEAERQALAMMDHPNIARVLDAGATETGRPYFVMELVHGVCITEYCDQNNLTPRQRLELFVPVCRAVQHAHQKGIIHRDLKPSNVLVTMHDGVPVPKVIDFGVAKATSGRLTDKTLFTEYHHFVGTPEYMSPEQAEMSGLDIDTRADVYALGVLLYELLTGTTPFDGKQLRKAAYAEIQRIIREVEPPKPSTRLSTLGETLTTVAARRSIDPKKLSALLRGDLDWIVMKCLEKDRTRRYETANAIAMDVQRHLKDEPVEASPPSATYKLGKFARKHRREAVALVALVVTLLMGIIGTTAGLLRSRVLLGRAQTAEQIANQARERAERQAGRANAVSDFMAGILTSARPANNYWAEDIRVLDVLRIAADSVDRKLKNQPEAEAQVRETIGQTYFRIGWTNDGEDQLRRAYELACNAQGEESPQALRIASQFTSMTEDDDAVLLARKSYGIAKRKLGENNPLTEDLEVSLALPLFRAGKFIEAAEAYRKIIQRSEHRGKTISELSQLYNNYTLALAKGGRLEEADGVQRQVIERMQAEPDKVDVVDFCRARVFYGQILMARGKWDEAKRVIESAIARQQDLLGPTNSETRQTLSTYADALEANGRYREALEKQRELLETDRILSRDNDVASLMRRVRIAELLLMLGEQEEATSTMNEAIVKSQSTMGELSKFWMDEWSATLLESGLRSEANWRSQNFRANVWCALDEHLVERPGVGNLDVDCIDWNKVRFRLERWNVSAGVVQPVLIPVAEGSLQDLKGLGEPAPGIYRLSLDVARPHATRPEARESWLLITDWDVKLYIPDKEATPDDYKALLMGKPAEQRRVSDLIIPYSGSKPPVGPSGRTQYFALAASTTVELPAGRYRFCATSDDGVRLYIDGRLIIDSWLFRSPDRDDAVLDLASGHHQLRVEYFQSGRGSELWLQLAPAGQTPTTPLPLAGGSFRDNRRPKPDVARILAALTAEIQRRPHSARPLMNRADFLVRQGRFKEAVPDFADRLKIEPSDHSVWASSAVVSLVAGDIESYRRQCSEMLKRFGASTDRSTCERVVRDCTLLPDAVPDLTPVMAMADRAVAPNDHEGAELLAWRALAKGTAEYRAGHFEPAAHWLKRAIRGGDASRESNAYFFLAMAEFQCGRGADAEAAFIRGTDLISRSGYGDTFPQAYKDWIAAPHPRREAAALLGHPVDSPATQTSR